MEEGSQFSQIVELIIFLPKQKNKSRSIFPLKLPKLIAKHNSAG